MIGAGTALLESPEERFFTPAIPAAPAVRGARDFSRLERFLDVLTGEVYPEPPTGMHATISQSVIGALLKDGLLTAGMRVLDVGCGQGETLELFGKLGMDATGITLGTDYDICRAKNLDVQQMDQNFMTFAEGSFDFLWCRHVLEHSFAPLFTLTEYRRVTRPGGLVYVEVPAPATFARHESNPNHYSVLPIQSWLNLFMRAKLAEVRIVEMNITTPNGPDLYWSALLRREA
jgi:SAM-dependent methyltransferase